MAPARTIIIAGAGIGGLSAALALAANGFRVTLIEQSERLEETGAGIQLSPNATRVLLALGLGERLKPHIVAPSEVRIRTSAGDELARMPLGKFAERRYGAPYWMIHRANLQAALLEAVRANPNIALKLGTHVEDYAAYQGGVTVACRHTGSASKEDGLALVGADGLWSSLRARLDPHCTPNFRQRTAWRALAPAADVDPQFREEVVQLWLGRDAHIVHYPVKAGAMINIVAIVRDQWAQTGWSTAGAREEIRARFSDQTWAQPARALLAAPQRWLKWALYDCPPLQRWSDGPVTLLGDAAHPMLPFLAQGAAMAMEDAAVLTACLARTPADAAGALRRYESQRRERTHKVQRAARSNSTFYHLAGIPAFARNLALRTMGGERLLTRYDWLYDWRPESE